MKDNSEPSLLTTEAVLEPFWIFTPQWNVCPFLRMSPMLGFATRMLQHGARTFSDVEKLKKKKKLKNTAETFSFYFSIQTWRVLHICLGNKYMSGTPLLKKHYYRQQTWAKRNISTTIKGQQDNNFFTSIKTHNGDSFASFWGDYKLLEHSFYFRATHTHK